MKKGILSIVLLVAAWPLIAQSTSPAGKKPSATDIVFHPDTQVTVKSEVVINGQTVPYRAVTGTQPVWDDKGRTIAGLFYTYYERTDVKDRAARPVVISFNGGPGSASVWMHLAYTGPAILKIDDEGYPVQPYGYTNNPHSILDIADIVYVDPVNTGYSRIVDTEVPRSVFFGVNADIKYLAGWISSFISRYERWASPKYLIGESYGTTRVAGLAQELQQSHWMYCNGVILVSPTTLGIERSETEAAALRLPYFAATAWYHRQLPPDLQQKDLTELLPEVEAYTMQTLIGALSGMGWLPEEKKKDIARQIARYSGLPESVVLQNNLQVPLGLFWKELLRGKGYTIGRLDSRYLGIDKKDAGERPDFNAELSSWLHSFTPAINMYIREKLQYRTDARYKMFGPVHPWDRTNDRTGEALGQAMAANPYLHVLVQSGYYDGACDYFNARYNMWQIDPSGKLKDRIEYQTYRSGHMMYLRKEDLISSNEHIRAFIRKSLPARGQPAKY